MKVTEFQVKQADGSDLDLSKHKGKVLLIVNTASKCGFTPQYEGLEKLHQEYEDKGLEILAFPCNQFGNQEPGDADEIRNFCSLNYDVSFPLMGKIEVNGNDADPLWKYLKSEKSGLLGSRIKWNFTKFLVDRDGNVVARFGPAVKPEQLKSEIEALL
ncbi:MAG: glutathione peroxidase [Sphingomonadales bacterium]|nr:glutathione peroxidase [Sphingomonadales bacterium]PIX66729.1 MAG: glutathione peroxidase [Sphingomonadales bacterium CG_4_10_14_3_um_filter_58_15]NCO47935.1 glutathione peroxidase [Sphingomonadales bacterium]NCP01058.1 glutathione peroxidase [Sphingomonadales bacterium]NCP26427.1 glutathione peroxidase [Sphingomonadales bacterium]